jgi:abequosyltransferase
VKLSFCIPTYNHARFLGAALDSILAQVVGEFEIVIVDGASTDNTSEVVAEYQNRTPAIRYRRMPVNRGIDPDIAEVVAMATGDYIWLMSSDDVIAEGAVAEVVEAATRGRALYLGARLVCTKDLEVFGDDQVFATSTRKTWDFASEAGVISYLQDAGGLIALFSYISVLIFRRDLWNSVADGSEHFGSCYAHAFRLWQALVAGGEVEFLGAAIMMCRMDTDNFSSRGVFRRFLLDFDGYLGIADTVFGNRPKVRNAFLEAMRREHGVFRLAKFYHGCVDLSQRQIALARIRSAGYSRRQVLAMKAIAHTGPLVSAAVALRRRIRQRIGRTNYQGL